MKHIFTLVVALFSVVALYAQQENNHEQIDAQWFKSHYKKAESLIPMRDGTKLYTVTHGVYFASLTMPFACYTPLQCHNKRLRGTC